ncbi:hypothetical protein HN011_002465 [Eciton burchellii]|nr:hypothetical protein HN011_002465 [Eciton burchellii]
MTEINISETFLARGNSSRKRNNAAINLREKSIAKGMAFRLICPGALYIARDQLADAPHRCERLTHSTILILDLSTHNECVGFEVFETARRRFSRMLRVSGKAILAESLVPAQRLEEHETPCLVVSFVSANYKKDRLHFALLRLLKLCRTFTGHTYDCCSRFRPLLPSYRDGTNTLEYGAPTEYSTC